MQKKKTSRFHNKQTNKHGPTLVLISQIFFFYTDNKVDLFIQPAFIFLCELHC